MTIRSTLFGGKTIQQFCRVWQRRQISFLKTPRLEIVPPSRNILSVTYQALSFSISAKTNPNPTLVSVANNYKSECVELKWNGNETNQYPYLWLRDNCQCPSCYNASSMSRRLLMRQLDPKSAPAEIKVIILV